MVTDALGTFSTILAGVKTISDIATTITNAGLRQELNSKIADLQGAIIATRQQIMEMQDRYEAVVAENKRLKAATAPAETPTVMWGCYQFEGDEGLYCTACYDTKRQKSLTTRIDPTFRYCPVCKIPLGSG